MMMREGVSSVDLMLLKKKKKRRYKSRSEMKASVQFLSSHRTIDKRGPSSKYEGNESLVAAVDKWQMTNGSQLQLQTLWDRRRYEIMALPERDAKYARLIENILLTSIQTKRIRRRRSTSSLVRRLIWCSMDWRTVGRNHWSSSKRRSALTRVQSSRRAAWGSSWSLRHWG